MKTPCSENHEKEYGIPTLEELSQSTAALREEQFPGGEQEALRRLDEHMKRTVLQFHAHVFFLSTLLDTEPASKPAIKNALLNLR